MSGAGPSKEDLDRVAERALAEVKGGTMLGLGTGRAAEAFIRRLGRAVKEEGLAVRGVATSERSEALAREVGVPTLALADAGPLDVAFDGADEVAPDRSLTKGLGGAQLRERVVASEAKRFVILATAEKLVDKLGSRCPIPVEVVPFAVPTVERRLVALGARPARRMTPAGVPYATDNGNAILDAHVAPLDDPRGFDAKARAIPGVVDVGLFFDLASLVLVGGSGPVREI
jgi:ribose 5-phosphate isomerase A